MNTYITRAVLAIPVIASLVMVAQAATAPAASAAPSLPQWGGTLSKVTFYANEVVLMIALIALGG